MEMTAWLEEIVLIVFITTFLDLLLPNGALTNFVRMVMGLFLLVSILNPIVGLLREDALLGSWHLLKESEEAQAVLAQGQALSKTQNEKTLRAYEESLEQQITALVYLVDGVKECETEVMVDFETVKSITVTVNAQADQQKIIRLIAMYYNFDQKLIEVRTYAG